MERYGYKTTRAMFKDMLYCSIQSNGSLITIKPSHHRKLDQWGWDRDFPIENVVVPADSSPGEIGAALRLGFSRCT